MNKIYHVERREFLNKFTSMRAYIIAVVEDARERYLGNGEDNEWHEITLKIADCSEEIDLYFDLSTTEERENSLHKVQILAEVIQEFKEAIELEIAVINARHVLPQKAMAASTIH